MVYGINSETSYRLRFLSDSFVLLAEFDYKIYLNFLALAKDSLVSSYFSCLAVRVLLIKNFLDSINPFIRVNLS